MIQVIVIILAQTTKIPSNQKPRYTNNHFGPTQHKPTTQDENSWYTESRNYIRTLITGRHSRP